VTAETAWRRGAGERRGGSAVTCAGCMTVAGGGGPGVV